MRNAHFGVKPLMGANRCEHSLQPMLRFSGIRERGTMHWIYGFIVLLFASQAQARQPTASIDAFIAEELPASGAPGIAYAVVDGNDVHTGAQGMLVDGGEDQITPDTPFLIGSVSKSFTAVAVLQLAEAGQIDLDDEIAQYLPIFADGPSGQITIRQLLSHTSGYSTVQGNMIHEDRSRSPGELAEHVARIAEWDLAFSPGERWEYSNANYHILGLLIERESGQGYAAYVQTRILMPLGMENSFVADGGPPRASAIGHRPWFGGHRPYPLDRTQRVGAPAGGVYSSVNDLAVYMAMLLNGEDDIISAENKAVMLRPAGDVSPFYGLGWFVDSQAGTVFHGGLVPGSESLLTLVPSDRSGVVILVNANSGIGFGETHRLRNGITALALGFDYEGEGSRTWQRIAYLSVVTLPLIFAISIVWAWWSRAALRAKSGGFGQFSLWFPLLATGVMAWLLMFQIPQLFGGTFWTILLFQPDIGWSMMVAAITGPCWAIFRLLVAKSKPKLPVG